ncbi:MAG: glycosyltransferase [Chloroflexi bacterium]|nr:glycosyltransferase [Chloroflexota bacterium]
MKKANLLFITSVLPASTGHGSAMRAYQTVNTLSKKYHIYMLILNFGYRNKVVDSESLDYCEKAIYIPVDNNIFLILQRMLFKLSPTLFFLLLSKPKEGQFITRKQIKKCYHFFAGHDFETIHVFRLYMAPFVQPYRDDGFQGKIQVDLDDIESFASIGMSQLYRQHGEKKTARKFSQNAKVYKNEERKWLPTMDRVFVCKESDRLKLIENYQISQVEVLPNVVAMPKAVKGSHPDTIFTFLFVGVLDYFPNYDGLIYFCKQVLPLIKQISTTKFKVKIVGNGVKEKLVSQFAHLPEVDVVGFMPDIWQVYAGADAVIVPLRAGGGTRIKILEAFSFQKPVISTPIGAEGIQAEHETHILIGETPNKFAQSCVRLIEDQDLRHLLSKNSYALFQEKYAPHVLDPILIGEVD